jgi:hypothetical protein
MPIADCGMSPVETARRGGTTVPQVSKPAVSPISKSADRTTSCDWRVWKPAIQQTWKSALRRLSNPGQVLEFEVRCYAFNSYQSQFLHENCHFIHLGC